MKVIEQHTLPKQMLADQVPLGRVFYFDGEYWMRTHDQNRIAMCLSNGEMIEGVLVWDSKNDKLLVTLVDAHLVVT